MKTIIHSGCHTYKAYGIQLLEREPHIVVDQYQSNGHCIASDDIVSNREQLNCIASIGLCKSRRHTNNTLLQ